MSMSKYVDGWRWQILAVTGKEFEALPVRLVLRVFRVCDSLHRVLSHLHISSQKMSHHFTNASSVNFT